jgi:hypothetical protein
MGAKMRNLRVVYAVGVAALLASACNNKAPNAPTAPAGALVELPQGWSPDQKTSWYTASQGSRLLPLSWARALEQAGSTAKFLDPAHISALGYLAADDGKPDSLPIGFVKDVTPDSRLSNTGMHWKKPQGDGTDPKTAEPWLGLNCSACHTAQLTYAGKTIRVQGGPALSDFQTFLVDLRASLMATLPKNDPAKFDRFAKEVLAGNDETGQPIDNADNRKMLTTALQALADHENALAKINATDLKYGYGRLDAFGHIYSKVAYAAAGANAVPQPSDAPTSYPYVWGIAYQDKIQYNGVATNTPITAAGVFDAGALARNTGEVIGVFADLSLTNKPLKGYRSSINVQGLGYFETELQALRAPPWPGEAVLGDKGKIDPALVARGRVLFGTDNTDRSKTTCATCHAVVPPNDQTRQVKVHMSLFGDADPPGTDPWMACNAFIRTSPTGVLKGSKKLIFVGDKLGDEAPIVDMLTNTAAGTLLDQKGKVVALAAASLLGVNRPPAVPSPSAAPGLSLRDQQLQTCMTTPSPILGYKGKPLNGIWATAPYLHNGSVPNLWELLNPAKRSPTFWVGNREFDPDNVGYVSKENVGTKFDTSLPGNSNKGHDYGASKMSDDDRKALIAYMKTL